MHKYGYHIKHPHARVSFNGTVNAPCQQSAQRLVAWVHGGTYYAKGSGHPRTKIKILRHPMHCQIRDGKAGNHIDWPEAEV